MVFAFLMFFAVWPDTPAAAMARQWVAAFPTEETMRAFLVRSVDEEGLRQRSVDERISTWRESKKKLGKLKLASIVSSKPEELKAMLAASDGQKYLFTFTVQSSPPHKLVSITRAEMRRHGFGLFPGH